MISFAKEATFSELNQQYSTNLFVCMGKDKIHVTPRCPIRTTLELIGGKWKLIILQQLYSNSALRLSELQVLIPDISQKMLIQELKTLVESGLASRRNFGVVPPRVEYALTEKGKRIKPLIDEMIKFAKLYEA